MYQRFSPSVRRIMRKGRRGSSKWGFLKNLFKWFLVIVLVFLIWISSFFLLSKFYVLEIALGLMPTPQFSGINILVYGTDDTRRVQRSDSIILLHLPDSADRITALSIPRDTYLSVPGIGNTKINHAFSHGGDALLKIAVSQFLDVPVHHTVKVNLSGVEKMIDAVGGVVVDVPKHLQYNDYAGDLEINIPKGRRRLTGKEAVQFLRFRHDNKGDIGRIERQQLFLRELVEQTLSAGTFFRLPSILWSLRTLIQTDLTLFEMISLAQDFSSALKDRRLEKLVLPGKVGVLRGGSYWLVDEDKVSLMMKDSFFQSNKPLYALESTHSSTETHSDIEDSSLDVITLEPYDYDPEKLFPEGETESREAVIISDVDHETEFFEQVSEIVPIKEIQSDLIVIKPSLFVSSNLILSDVFLKEVEDQFISNFDSVVSVVPIPEDRGAYEERDRISLSENRAQIDENFVVSFPEAQPNPHNVIPDGVDLISFSGALMETEWMVFSSLKDMDMDLSHLNVELLVGNGRIGEAAEAEALFLELGFTVFKSHYSKRVDYEQTKLVDWKGNVSASSVLSKMFFIDRENIVVYDRLTKPIDFTFVLGNDWDNIKRKFKGQLNL